MRLGVLFETKRDFPRRPDDPDFSDSELLSDEEEAALLSGLRDAGYSVVEIGDAGRLIRRAGYWRRRVDLVFNLSVGYRGTERKLHGAAALELAGIPYVGSTPYVNVLTRNKYHAKLVVRAAGLATPRAALVTESGPAALPPLRYPVIVKPVAESSAVGIDEGSVVADPGIALARARALSRRFRQPAVVEEFVSGPEMEVPFFADPAPRALGVVAITRGGLPMDGKQFLTSEVVYRDGYGFGDPPGGVDKRSVGALAVGAACALGIRDYGRIDVRVDAEGQPFFIEAATQPHIQRHSSFTHLARRRGLAYPEMLRELVEVARRRLGLTDPSSERRIQASRSR